ncbi:UNVERIFIED_CONTAM: hypothetical protein GTU68_006778 [Idotea baltica]|nr:hypothetical protein [Idotea baltica]
MFTAPVAEAHCDGPCGVYDPASARVTAEAVPEGSDDAAWAGYLNSMSRFAAIKEEQAESTKHELLVLWTDYFKPDHLEAFPDLHETFWTATKQCSAAKQNVDVAAAEALMESVEKIHKMFWESKNRDVAWVPAVG